MSREISAKSLLAKAENAMARYDFHTAIALFRAALCKNPSSRAAKSGLLIADFCARSEGEGYKVAEIYQILRASDSKKSKQFILNVIAEIEAQNFANSPLDRLVAEQNGISYNDFLEILEAGRGFSDAFESVTRSTNLYISEKREWVDLVERLIDNGYLDAAYRFIESASLSWRSSEQVAALIAKLRGKEIRAESFITFQSV
ncbi:MAG: hypothetical protein LBU73_10450 [Helicobacteraceae bacterium]|jgi:methyl-accepting chemotaxis protein|nr:hypothetical protein [Helicobacteraceae bacterium]